MISLEQVRQLDIRVKKAVTAVKSFSAENAALKAEIADLNAKLEELTSEAAGRKADEQELEVSLQGVLDVLDEVEGETSDIDPEPPAENYIVDTVPMEDSDDSNETTGDLFEDTPEQAASVRDESSAVEPPPEPSDDTSDTAEPAEAAESDNAGSLADETPEDTTVDMFTVDDPDVAASDTDSDDTDYSDAGIKESAENNTDGSSTPREAEQPPAAAESVTEEVAGVGQVVEFTSSPLAADDQAEAETGSDSADSPVAEEVDLNTGNETEGEKESGGDEFSSEFDILMAPGNRLDISILGTSFTIRADEDEAYLKRILWYLEKKVEETKKRTPIADPMKISILTSFYIIDELLREKNRDGTDPALPAESEEMEKIALRLISEIDNAIGD